MKIPNNWKELTDKQKIKYIDEKMEEEKNGNKKTK